MGQVQKETRRPRVIDGGHLSWKFGLTPGTQQSWRNRSFMYRRETRTTLLMDGPDNVRKTFYPGYKAHRKEREIEKPEWKAKKEAVFSFVRKDIDADDRLDKVRMHGLEADDLIAAFCLLNKSKHPLLVIGEDKDLLQMGNLIHLESFGESQIFVSDFAKKLPKAIAPFVRTGRDILTVLTLLGDKSDDIPRLVPKGVRNLEILAKILQAEKSLTAACNFYPIEDVTRNLMLSILPCPWSFAKVLEPEELLEAVESKTYWKNPLREDIVDNFKQSAAGRVLMSTEDKVKALGY